MHPRDRRDDRGDNCAAGSRRTTITPPITPVAEVVLCVRWARRVMPLRPDRRTPGLAGKKGTVRQALGGTVTVH
jgi:hypothetical protein